jgi:hypothetical protein
VIATGCAGSKQAREVTTFSGFLNDYDRLEPGDKYEAKLRWIDSGADWRSYDKVMVDPIQAWGEAGKSEVDSATLQKLLDRFYVVLRDTLGEDYQIVSAPAPGAFRVQAAITRIGASVPALDGISTVLPIGFAASAVTEGVTGKPAFTGELALEMRVVDAMTSRALGEAVDTRVGGKKLGKAWDKWADAYSVMDTWAAMLKYRFCMQRGDLDCVPPKD